MRPFPRKFANSIVNPASVASLIYKYTHGLVLPTFTSSSPLSRPLFFKFDVLPSCGKNKRTHAKIQYYAYISPRICQLSTEQNKTFHSNKQLINTYSIYIFCNISVKLKETRDPSTLLSSSDFLLPSGAVPIESKKGRNIGL